MRYRSRQTGKFVPTEWARRHPDKVVEASSKRKQAGKAPRSVEYEVTATTRGGTPRKRPREGGRRIDQRVLQLKIRIVAPEGALQNEEDAMRLISKVKRGVPLPSGVQVLWLDWRKGEGGRATSGTVDRPDVQEALGNFWAALTSGRASIEMGR